MTTSSRPDHVAFEHAMRLPSDAQVVEELAGILGEPLTAVVGGVTEVRAVRGWIDGSRAIKNPDKADRLRFALYIASFIARCESPAAAQAWMQGLNPQLGDKSAVMLLRNGNLDEVGPEIAAAARAFIVGG